MAYPTITGTTTSIGNFFSLVGSVDASVPATTDAGHEQLMAVMYKPKAASPTPSGSWSTVLDQSSGDGETRLIVYKRSGVYSAGTVSMSFSQNVHGRVRGLAVTGVLDASSSTATSAYTSTAVAPSVTAVGAESLWVQLVGPGTDPRSLAAPGDTTAVSNIDNSASSYLVGAGVAVKQVAAGATGASGNWAFLDQDPPNSALGERTVAASLVFSQPVSGTVAVTGAGELPSVLSVSMEAPAAFIAVGATDVLTVTVKDQNDRALPNATVTINRSRIDVATASAPAVTDANGQTDTTLTGVAVGTVSLSATVGTITSSTVPLTVVSTGGGASPLLAYLRRWLCR
jgi:hypothetical protein